MISISYPVSYPVLKSSHILTAVAWGITILVSSLPDIMCVQLTGSTPTWLTLIKLALMFALSLTAFLWRPLRPLRNYFIILFVFFAGTQLRPQVDFTWLPLQGLFGNSVFDNRMQAEQSGKLIFALLTILTLLILGYKRHAFFLTRGNLRAPIEPAPLLGFTKPVPWPIFGLQWAIYIAVTLGVIQYLGLRPSSDLMLKALPILPSLIFYSALNAFNEEIIYRSPMLATLEPVGGSKHSLWMAAYFFGIAHYFGTPGGILGGIASIFIGWILGKSMVETRGLFWTWWIHFLSDIAIFSFMTMALLEA